MYYGLLCFKRWLSDKIKAHQTIFYQLAEIGSSFFPVGRFSIPILEKSVCVYKSVQFCVSFLWPFCSNKCNYWSIKRIKFKTETIVFYFSINDFLGHQAPISQKNLSQISDLSLSFFSNIWVFFSNLRKLKSLHFTKKS